MKLYSLFSSTHGHNRVNMASTTRVTNSGAMYHGNVIKLSTDHSIFHKRIIQKKLFSLNDINCTFKADSVSKWIKLYSLKIQ